jgi:glyoxylate reductase
MSVLYTSRTPKPSIDAELNAHRVSFDELLAASDFISVHVPLTPETRHLFDARSFAQTKSTAILVNASRGAVIDEAALVDALKTGRIAGAGLDVFEHEPSVHPDLVSMRERVVLSPHLGSATDSARRAMGDIAVENVLSVLAGRPPHTPVT